MTDDDFTNEIENQKALMIAVATGGPRIDEVNNQYIERRERLTAEFTRRNIQDPNPHGDLWAWYGHWGSSGMSTWAQRRVYISNLYQALIDHIRSAPSSMGASLFSEPTGWERVDRGIDEVRNRLEQAENEEQFQSIGHLCRESLISVAQVVYDPSRHPTLDGVTPSSTDFKRMIEAYISVELAGRTNEGARKHAKAAFSLANDLQHHRTATYRQAALCAEATTSVINLIAIIFGRRDRAD